MAERHQIVLVVAVVVAVQGQFGARHQCDRVQMAHIGLSDLFQPAGVVFGGLAFIDQMLQVLEGRQHDDAQGGETLLAVDDIEDLVVGRLQDQIAHVVGGGSAGRPTSARPAPGTGLQGGAFRGMDTLGGVGVFGKSV